MISTTLVIHYQDISILPFFLKNQIWIIRAQLERLIPKR